MDISLNTELVDINSVFEHPENYQQHPDDQLDHIIRSIEENGVYRNIVVSKDNYILAGHGVRRALLKMGYNKIPVVRVNFMHDSSQARKLIVGDNEISHLSEVDNIQLIDLLKKINIDNNDLLGTGFTEGMLTNLALASLPESEINDAEMAREWVGLPLYETYKDEYYRKLTVIFKTEDDYNSFVSSLNLQRMTNETNSIWYPQRDKDDMKSVAFL